MEMCIRGTVKRVFLPNGYGFIEGTDKVDYFMHTEHFLPGQSWDGEHVYDGAEVEFVPSKGKKGPRALEIQLLP